MRHPRIAHLAAAALVALCFGCSSSRAGQRPVSGTAGDAAATPASEIAASALPTAPSAGRACVADLECDDGSYCDSGTCTPGPRCEATVRFAFDEAHLTPEARSSLVAAADCVRSRKWTSVRLEGHADERGTSEYNLHLGQRRAEAVQQYLRNLGLAAPMDAMSFGEESPVSLGHGEDDWALNRRVELRRGDAGPAMSRTSLP